MINAHIVHSISTNYLPSYPKNSCPLCQNTDIATEIRSFEPAEEENESNSEDGMIRRLRSRAPENLIDIATGRTRRRIPRINDRQDINPFIAPW